MNGCLFIFTKIIHNLLPAAIIICWFYPYVSMGIFFIYSLYCIICYSLKRYSDLPDLKFSENISFDALILYRLNKTYYENMYLAKLDSVAIGRCWFYALLSLVVALIKGCWWWIVAFIVITIILKISHKIVMPVNYYNEKQKIIHNELIKEINLFNKNLLDSLKNPNIELYGVDCNINNIQSKIENKKDVECYTNRVDYNVGKILYLIDWNKYMKMVISRKYETIAEIYIFRAWMYSFTFRLKTNDNDKYVEPMLYELLNHLRTLGNNAFIASMMISSGKPLTKSIVSDMSIALNEQLLNRFEQYDQSVVVAKRDGKNVLQEIISAFIANIVITNERLNVGFCDFTKIMFMIENEVCNPAKEIAEQAMSATDNVE